MHHFDQNGPSYASNESRGDKFYPLSIFLTLGTSCLVRKASRNRRPSGADHLNGFQPSRNTIACLQFDHAQRFESFALQFYGEFNWKYGQIGLLCSLWEWLSL